jgi:hypothetical protein
MADESPTPWKAVKVYGYGGYHNHDIRDAENDSIILDVGSEEGPGFAEADALLIVRAVNAHERPAAERPVATLGKVRDILQYAAHLDRNSPMFSAGLELAIALIDDAMEAPIAYHDHRQSDQPGSPVCWKPRSSVPTTGAARP